MEGVAAVVICANSVEDEEERLTMPAAAIITLQKSSQFNNLFNQLELIANERRMVTKALVSIALGAGVECFAIEARVDKAFLYDTNVIIFSDEFNNLFNQLELIANERRMVTKALLSIALGAGVECFATEARVDKAFFYDTNEITFNDEDMEVGYSNHRRPLYLTTSINQIPIKRALVKMALQ